VTILSQPNAPNKTRERRSQGQGSITKLADGRWRGRLDFGWEEKDGKRRRKRKVYYGRTERDVEGKLNRARVERARGLRPPTDERQRLGAFLTRWLHESVRFTVRPSSFDGYERLVRLHVAPHIADKVLARLDAQDLASLYGRLLDAGLNPNTVRHVHVVLHRALRQAERWGLIPRNVADLVDAPRAARQEMTVLTAEQSRRLLETAQDDPLYALYVLALTTGMRSGELLALKWADVDWERGALRIRRQIGRTSQGLAFSEPKTAKGRRTISLSALAVDALRGHRAAQVEARLQLGPYWRDEDLVFTNALRGPLERQNVHVRSWKPLLQRAGLPDIRFHDLRHSAATLLLSLGEHPKVVQERLGHATIAVTMDIYSHVMPELQRETAGKLDAVFTPVRDEDAPDRVL
jgi:integrase